MDSKKQEIANEHEKEGTAHMSMCNSPFPSLDPYLHTTDWGRKSDGIAILQDMSKFHIITVDEA